MGEIAEVLNNEVLAERFKRVAPVSINLESEKAFAIQLMNNNTWLAKVASEAPNSLLSALTNVATIGLSLNPAKKQAYLITRNIKNKDGKWQQRIFLEPSYMGLCDIATLSGCIDWVQARIVYASDTYRNTGPDSKPAHESNPFAKKDARGDIVGVYCTAKTVKGDYLTTEMPIDEIFSIRDRSEAWKKSQSGPWKTDFNEMAKKTVVRQAFKMWPKQGMDRAEIAVSMSNENEGFAQIETEPELNTFTANQKEYFDQLISKEDSMGMYVFRNTTSDSIFISLYHSFPKGKKGHYQRIVDSLERKGLDSFTCCLDAIIQALHDNDPDMLSETTEELSETELSLIMSRLTPEQSSIFNEMQS